MASLGKLAIAVLGILAYQNRDKIGKAIRGAGYGTDNPSPQGGILDQLASGVSGTALGDVLDRFRDGSAGSKVDSWVRTGPNLPMKAEDVVSAIDEETLSSLSQQTGLSRDELVARIMHDLPEAVDRMTPDGKMPPVNVASTRNIFDDMPTRPLDE